MDAGKIATYRQRLAAALGAEVTPAQRELILDGVCELLSIADSLARIARALEVANAIRPLHG